ncbi:MAG: dienelactone hydrolase family protein [Chloroflexi bacterium]|nr:dienelactone hydrolase family protein [Chloroflexota bacterium]
MPEARHFQYNVTVGNIRVVVDAHVQVPAFWAHPQIGGPFPGLILLHDDWGLDRDDRAIAHRFAEIGYYVMVPDLFEGNVAKNQMQADVLENRYLETAPIKVGAALKALETHHKCNAKMAVVGWDLGGYLAIKLGMERTDVMAAVSFYGDASPLLGKLSQLKCPVLSIFGEADPLTAKLHDAMAAELKKANPFHEVVVYPEASHGFYNDLRPTYHAEAAEAAWPTVLNFLKRYQGEPPPPEEASPGYFKPGRVY